MNDEFKLICKHCGGHIAYNKEYSGREVSCPHCQNKIMLGVGNDDGQSYHDTPASKANVETSTTAIKARPTSRKLVLISTILLMTAIGAGLGVLTVLKSSQTRKAAEELTRTRLDAENAKAEALKARAEAEAAKTEAKAQAARLQQEREEKARSEAERETGAVEAAVKKHAEEQQAQLELERKNKVTNNPRIIALWDETKRESIQIASAREKNVTVNHNGSSVTAKYEELPDWLQKAARTKYKQDGEERGQIREVDGVVYDLRSSPPGWVSLPLSEVFQIIEDGYIMVEVSSLDDDSYRSRVFKLKHNGLIRILNEGDRIQMPAMSVGTFTYITKANDVRTVPVYDPGMPQGSLRSRVVTMSGKPEPGGRKTRSHSGEPIGNGSGFFISEDGLFVSNAHVVEDSVKIEVRTAAGKKPATVLRVDKDKDLALLRVTLEKGSVQALRISTNSASLGMEVFTVGYPLVELQGSRPKFTDGKVSSVAGIRDDPDQMQISVAVQPGNSGGPLANANGDVVGIVVAQLNDLKVMELAGAVPQNVNYAVKGSTLLRFLKENKDLAPGVTFGDSPKRPTDEAIKIVEKASGLVLIY